MPPRSLMPTLSALRDDLTHMRVEAFPWDAAVRAERTLPSGEPVEAWYLAGFFLRLWANGIARAGAEQIMVFGPRPSASNIAVEQNPSRHRNDALAEELAHDTGLDPYLAEHVELLANSLIGPSPDSRYAGGLVRAAVETHEWCVLLSVLADMQREPTAIASRPLPGFRKSLGILARSVREFALSLSDTQRAHANELMTNYRNSTLAFSWMPYCQGDPNFDIEDPLFPGQKEMTMIRELADRVAGECKGIEGVPVVAIRSVVEKIAEAILQRGYPEFAADIASLGLFADRDRDLGGIVLPINVIPHDHRSECGCAPLLVAVARSGGKTSLKKIIPMVRKHLIDCEITNAVIIVTDEWNPGILGDSLGDLKSQVAKGKKIIFLFAPQPGSDVVYLPISLH